jgi:hypothetical protein
MAIGNESWLACGVLVDPTSSTGPAELRRLVAAGARSIALDAKFILTPPCIFHWQCSYKIHRVASAQNDFNVYTYRARVQGVPLNAGHVSYDHSVKYSGGHLFSFAECGLFLVFDNCLSPD